MIEYFVLNSINKSRTHGVRQRSTHIYTTLFLQLDIVYYLEDAAGRFSNEITEISFQLYYKDVGLTKTSITKSFAADYSMHKGRWIDKECPQRLGTRSRKDRSFEDTVGRISASRRILLSSTLSKGIRPFLFYKNLSRTASFDIRHREIY